MASHVSYFLPTPSPKMRPSNHTDAENEPTWKPVEFPSMTGAIVVLRGRALWLGKQGERLSALSRHLPQRFPLPCCLEVQALPSEAEGNVAERNRFMETTVVPDQRPGKRVGSGLCPAVCPWGTAQRNLGANSTHSVYSGVSSLSPLRKQLCKERENRWVRQGTRRA